MTEKILDPLAGQTGATALQLLRVSDDDVRRYVAYWEQKEDTHRAAGRTQALWWAAKSVSGGRYELTQRGIDRETETSSQGEARLPRSVALQISRGPGPDSTPETWVRDSTFGWVCLEDDDDGGPSFADVLRGVADGTEIQVVGPGCTLEEVLAALPPSDADDSYDDCVVFIDAVAYGRFSRHGWYAFDDERPDLPAYHPLAEITVSEEGGFTSGSSVSLLGEIRPGAATAVLESRRDGPTPRDIRPRAN